MLTKAGLVGTFYQSCYFHCTGWGILSLYRACNSKGKSRLHSLRLTASLKYGMPQHLHFTGTIRNGVDYKSNPRAIGSVRVTKDWRDSVCKTKTALKFSLITNTEARSQRKFVSDKAPPICREGRFLRHPSGSTTLRLPHSAIEHYGTSAEILPSPQLPIDSREMHEVVILLIV